MATFQAKQDGKGCEREKRKIFVPFRSYPTPNVKTPKQLKKLKNTIMGSFQAKIGWKRPIKNENKNYRSVLFLSDT